MNILKLVFAFIVIAACLVWLVISDRDRYKHNTGPNSISMQDKGQRYEYRFVIRGKKYTSYSDRKYTHKQGALDCADFIQYRRIKIALGEGDIRNGSEHFPILVTNDDLDSIEMQRIDRNVR